MPKVILTDARVKALRPRRTAYDIRDGKLKGFGVRVLPSGRKRFFVHCQHRGDRVWKIVGIAEGMTVGEARSRAVRTLAAIRCGEDPPRNPAETLFEAVAETVFERYRRLWKPRNARCQPVLPEEPDPAPLPRTASRRHRPAGCSGLVRFAARDAGRRRPLNAGALRHLEGGGSHGSSAGGLQPLPGHPALSPQGARALPVRRGDTPPVGARLSAHAANAPQQVAVVRLLLLTGCRKSEILTLRWSDYREGHLFLRDSKTGPRTVWLSQPARNVLDGLDRTGQWVFPAARGKGPRNKGWLEGFWDTVRAEAGLRGVRLHDLRHTHASIALRQGETVLTIARLLGHRNPETTLKYTHLADKTVMDAAETVGAALDA